MLKWNYVALTSIKTTQPGENGRACWCGRSAAVPRPRVTLAKQRGGRRRPSSRLTTRDSGSVFSEAADESLGSALVSDRPGRLPAERHTFVAPISKQISGAKRKEEAADKMSAPQLSFRAQICLMGVIFKQALIPAHPSWRGG